MISPEDAEKIERYRKMPAVLQMANFKSLYDEFTKDREEQPRTTSEFQEIFKKLYEASKGMVRTSHTLDFIDGYNTHYGYHEAPSDTEFPSKIFSELSPRSQKRVFDSIVKSDENEKFVQRIRYIWPSISPELREEIKNKLREKLHENINSKNQEQESNFPKPDVKEIYDVSNCGDFLIELFKDDSEIVKMIFDENINIKDESNKSGVLETVLENSDDLDFILNNWDKASAKIQQKYFDKIFENKFLGANLKDKETVRNMVEFFRATNEDIKSEKIYDLAVSPLSQNDRENKTDSEFASFYSEYLGIIFAQTRGDNISSECKEKLIEVFKERKDKYGLMIMEKTVAKMSLEEKQEFRPEIEEVFEEMFISSLEPENSGDKFQVKNVELLDDLLKCGRCCYLFSRFKW